MWDVHWFNNKYNFANYNSKDNERLRIDLELDFSVDIKQVFTLKEKQQVVFGLMQKISYFGNTSRNKVPCSSIWKILFTTVIIPSVTQKDKSFFELYNFFDDTKKWFRDRDEEIVIQKNNIYIDKHLDFMELKVGFTEKELKRNYRIMCLRFHPDKPGGSAEKFNELQFVRRELEKYLLTNKR